MMHLPQAFLSQPLAHRGLHDRTARRPENSRAAVAAAIAAGYGIEIDLQLSADGRAMVFHDDGLERLTAATGPVRDRSSADLGQLGLLGGDETIPTFREILDLVAGRVPLLVEIKDQDGSLGPDVGLLERAVAGDADGYRGPIAFMSFNPHSVMALAEAAPKVPRGLTTSAFPAKDWPTVPQDRREALAAMTDLDATGAAFISHGARDLASPAVARARATGRSVLCWTIRSPADEARARRYADNITFEDYLPT